jgi:hypothetical protein
MLNIIQARADCLNPGDLINIDVEGFTYDEIEGDDRVEI